MARPIVWISRSSARDARSSMGCLLSVDSDAHKIAEFDHLDWGISQARRAWVEPDQVLNTRSRADLLAWVAAKPDRV